MHHPASAEVSRSGSTRAGFDLVLVARREAALEDLAREVERIGRRARVLAADLASDGAATQLHERLERDAVVIDVLVNNAGVGMQGLFEQLPLERQLAMIQLNVGSLTDPGGRNRFMALAVRFLPRAAVARSVKSLNTIEDDGKGHKA